MAAVASIDIVVNENAAVAQIGAVGGALTGLKGPAAEAGAVGGAAMETIGKSALTTKEEIRLLNEEVGIRMPRALQSVMAMAPGLSAVLRNAFPVLAAVGFVSILESYGHKIAEISARAFDWDGALKQLVVDEGALNTAMVAQIKNAQDLADKYALLGQTGLPRFNIEQDIANQKQAQARETMLSAKKALDDYTASLQHMTDVVDVNAEATGMGGGQVQHQPSAQELIQRAALSKALIDAQVDLANKTFNSVSATQSLNAALDSAFDTKHQTAIDAATHSLKEMAAAEDAVQQRITEVGNNLARFRAEGEAMVEADRQARVKASADAALADVDAWQKGQDIRMANEEKFAKEAEHAARKYEEVWLRARDHLANSMEKLFNDITSGNIGQTMLRMFEQLVFKMVATWAMGMAQMQGSTGDLFRSVLGLMGINTGGGGGGGSAAVSAATGGGGGGFLHRLFGGGGAGGGANAAFAASGGFAGGEAGVGSLPLLGGGMSDTSSLGLLGLGLSAGGGLEAGAALPAGSMFGAGTGILGMLGALGPLGAILGAVGGASQIGFGGPMSGAISGGLLGGLAGAIGVGGLFGLGGLLASSGIMAGVDLIGALSGPIGWAIVGVTALLGALFGGIFGGGAKRHKRDDIERQAFAQMKMIESEFNLFTLDYNSAYSQMEQVRTQTATAMHGLGMKDRMDPWIDEAEKRMSATEKDRQTRSQLNFSPAEFESGGFVSPGLAGSGFASSPAAGAFYSAASMGRIPSMGAGGAIPAIVHGGEYVMSRPAVDRIGRGNLDFMNAGGGGGHTFINNISAMDTKSFAQWLAGGGAEEIAKAFFRLHAEGFN